MTRREELESTILENNRSKCKKLIDEVLFMEARLEELKKLPQLKVDEKNPIRQKATPAAKQYKEMLQQYNNTLRLLYRINGDFGEDGDEESPLRLWTKGKMDDNY